MNRTSHVFFAMPCLMEFFSTARFGHRPPPVFRIVRLWGLTAAVTLLVGCGSESEPRPNLILITVDRLAADRLACFGGPADAGRSLCALGEGGTLFAWAASPGRGEASGVASALTGLPESSHHVGHAGHEFLTEDHSTVAEGLREVGYETAAFVASPQVNLSRRLDQGFDLYDDRLASSSRSDASAFEDRPQTIQDWIDAAASPWFVWIHADRNQGLAELDRMVSKLSQTLDPKQNPPGVLFVALRGERGSDDLGIESVQQSITWRTHRIPLIWRPPHEENESSPRVSRQLASLMDVAPTLRAAAQVPPHPAPAQDFEARTSSTKGLPAGQDLTQLARVVTQPEADAERFLALAVLDTEGEVGLASHDHLYTRRSSALDGSGRPVPMASLFALKARFAAIPKGDSSIPIDSRSAKLEIGLWHFDVLGSGSPVPRLEFHLARGLVPAEVVATSPLRSPPNSQRSPERPEARDPKGRTE